MKLLEKQIEDVFEQHYKELISPDLELIKRQYIFKNNKRADLVFLDNNKRKVIVELKRDEIKRKDIGQIIEYRGILDDENPRIILIAPKIPTVIKKSFDHFGIEYIEFSIKKIQTLFSQLLDKDKPQKIKSPILKGIIKVPLPKNKIIDGNIAFKVSYNDKNWSGICSPDIYKENSSGKHKMFWCSNQEGIKNCQKWNNNELGINSYPCYDAVANLNLGFGPGWNHGQNKPHECLNAKVGKIAFLTSLEPGKSQNERFIFTIFQINKIMPKEEENGIEYYYGNTATAIKLSPNQYLKYWDYYSNNSTNKRFANFWGSGLFRYINDKIARAVLSEIINKSGFSKKQKENAGILLKNIE